MEGSFLFEIFKFYIVVENLGIWVVFYFIYIESWFVVMVCRIN